MMLTRRAFGAGLAAAAGLGGRAFAQGPSGGVPADAAVAEAVQALIADRKAVGIAVGLTGPGGRRFIAGGRRSDRDPRPPDADSVLQIGSITKSFTGAILMDMVVKGEVGLDQPVAELLPRGVNVPTRGGRQITLVDLATHTAGLPREPDGFEGADTDWAGFTDAVLLRLLPRWRPATDIGAAYAYSNVGMSLLALALRRRAGGVSYEALARQRLLDPLGLASTRVHPTAAMRRRFLPGFDEALKPVAPWRMDQAIVGAGGLVSTADDLLAWLEAQMGLKATPLASAMRAQLSVRRPKPAQPGDKGPREVAIGWHIDHRPGGEVVWHDGGARGYRAFAGWSPALRTGVAVLANCEGSDPKELAFRALGVA
jgi:CubicO group peptidase (beta-lactamase class C family)